MEINSYAGKCKTKTTTTTEVDFHVGRVVDFTSEKQNYKVTVCLARMLICIEGRCIKMPS